MGGRDFLGAGLLLRAGRTLGGAGVPADFGGFLSSDATSRSKASALGGTTDGVGLLRFGFEMLRFWRRGASESRSATTPSRTACSVAAGSGNRIGGATATEEEEGNLGAS